MTLEWWLAGNHNILQDVDAYTITAWDIKRIFFQDNPEITALDIKNNILDTVSYNMLTMMWIAEPTECYKKEVREEETNTSWWKRFNIFKKNDWII